MSERRDTFRSQGSVRNKKKDSEGVPSCGFRGLVGRMGEGVKKRRDALFFCWEEQSYTKYGINYGLRVHPPLPFTMLCNQRGARAATAFGGGKARNPKSPPVFWQKGVIGESPERDSVSATQKSDEVRPVGKKKKKTAGRSSSGRSSSGEWEKWVGRGPGVHCKVDEWGAAPQGTHPTPYRKIKASPLWRRADLRPHLWYPPLSFPSNPLRVCARSTALNS